MQLSTRPEGPALQAEPERSPGPQDALGGVCARHCLPELPLLHCDGDNDGTPHLVVPFRMPGLKQVLYKGELQPVSADHSTLAPLSFLCQSDPTQMSL